MKKIITILLFFIVFLGCSANKSIKKNYEITEVNFFINPSETILVKDFRTRPKYSHTDLQKMMLQNFGKWTNSINNKDQTPYLVWNNIKLLAESDELYTVAVSGKYEKFEIVKVNDKAKYGEIHYCSAIIFDSKGNDCLKKDSEEKNKIVQYLINTIKSARKQNLEFEKELQNDVLKSNSIK